MELKNFFVQDDAGNVLSAATCFLYERGTESLVKVLQGANGLALSNPFMSDQQGLVQFAAPDGLYDLRVVKESRDYRLRMQCNDVTEALASAESSIRVFESRLKEPFDPDNGVGMLGWQRSSASPSVYGLRGLLDSSRINVWEKQFVDLAIKPLSTHGDPKTWDWQPVLQGAINYVIGLAASSGSTYGLPAIVVPAFHYKLLSGITTAPWVKITFSGTTVFDFSGAPLTTVGITVNAKALRLASDVFSYTGPCVDASGGSLLVLGSGISTSEGAGIYIGNDVAGFSVAREVRIANVSVRNFNRAIEFGKYGTYLFSADNLRLENNFYGVVTPQGLVNNSGERMTFTNSIIGGSGNGGAAILHRCDTFDLFFTNCSFDFNHDIIRCESGAAYAAVTFDTCHFEAWDGYLVNWQSGGINFYINLNTCTILPTTYRLANQLKLNSASRNLINFGGSSGSRVDVRIDRPVIRNTNAPYTEDPFIDYDVNAGVGTGRKGCRITGYDAYSYGVHGVRNSVANSDFNFQLNAIGTAVPSMTFWEREVAYNVSDDALVDDGTGKKVLRLRGSSTDNHYIMRAKHFHPVNAGDTVFTWAALSIKGLAMPEGSRPEHPNVQLGCDIALADGTFIHGAALTVGMGTVFADSGNPNYSEGKSRYISSTSYGYLVPAGIVAVRPRIMFSNFKGDLYVSRIGMWTQ